MRETGMPPRWWLTAYLVLTGLAVLAMLALVPAMKAPDELAHFRRITQVIGGGIVAQRETAEPGPTGAWIDPAAETFLRALGPVTLAQPPAPAALAAASAIRWGGDPVFAAFPNTAAYVPTFYLPQLIGVGAGRVAGASVADSYGIGRVAAAIAVLLLGGLALRLARRGRVVILATLGLPMTVFLAASVSQDGPLIAGGALLAALLSRVGVVPGLAPLWWRLGVAGLLVAMGLARPPLVLLALIPLLPPWRAGFGGVRTAGLVPLAALGLLLWWSMLVDADAMHWLPGDRGVDAGRQLAGLLADPASVLRVAWATLAVDAIRLPREVIGVLGWLNLPLPWDLYPLGYTALGLAFLGVAAERGQALPWRTTVPLALLLLLVAGAMFGAQYLTWTPVGAAVV